jgi:uncharacterized membrane protein
MSDWLEHTVQIEVPVPIGPVWELWSDLEQMPRWMKWIDSVKVQPDNAELSTWKLASGAFVFTWQSKIVKQITHQIIQWESVDGLPNRGAIRFYDRGDDGSIVKMTIAYGIPPLLRPLMDNAFLGNIVESTLQADLDRFYAYAVAAAAPVVENSAE